MSSLEDRSAGSSRGGSRRRLTVVAASLAVAAAPLDVVWASNPGSGLEGRATPVSDEALGDIRGKFVSAGGVAYFSVELRSSWTNAEGVTVAGVLAMSLDMRSASGGGRSAVPLVLIGWSHDCGTCEGSQVGQSSANALTTTAPGGLNTVHGVVQSQEIRGSDNTVQNGLRINVIPANLVNAPGSGGLSPASGSSTQTLPGGGAVHFQITGSRLGLALQNGDQSGAVGQTVDAGQNQISQNVFLTSDMNRVQNSIGLTVGVDQMRQAELTNFQHSMSVLQGLGH